MNDQNEKQYPCDENAGAKRSYPCDAPAETKRSYPCDEPAGDASVFDNAGLRETRVSEGGRVQASGKGRRGGNAAASFVMRSGKEQTHADYTKDRYQWKKEREEAAAKERAERGDRFGRGGRFGDRPRRFDRDGAGRDGFGRERRPFDRDRRDRGEHGGRAFGGHERTERFGGKYRKAWADGGEHKPQRNEQNMQYDTAEQRELTVVENTEIGSFLAIDENTRVLLPFAEQIGRPAVGDVIHVYLYEDKGGRLTATMRTPILKDGEVGILRVAEVTRIGLFLDNGVPKQILVPFREQVYTPQAGDEVLVYIYRDKSGRQAATMRVYKHLDNRSPYSAEDRVKGFIYEINPKLGIFMAVDNRYFGMIPISEVYQKYRLGDTIEARVTKVREDGKLDLTTREKAYVAISQDAERVLEELKKEGGRLPYADKADAKLIEEVYGMSKNQFKRAVGYLYKQHLIAVDRETDAITLL